MPIPMQTRSLKDQQGYATLLYGKRTARGCWTHVEIGCISMNRKPRLIMLLILLFSAPLHAAATERSTSAPFSALNHSSVLIGLGDSLTQGTMDAADNSLNTHNAYLQKIYESLSQVQDTGFIQPLLNVHEKRIAPFTLPTNLGIDGSDIFHIEGLTYYKREGAAQTTSSREYLCNGMLPWALQDIYDNSLYPYNLLTGKPASQIDSAIWLLNFLHRRETARAIFILWIGNNDSSSAALGYGTNNPVFAPLPFQLIENELKPGVAALLRWAQENGIVSFEPYTEASIKRNLTELADFAAQYEHALARLETGVAGLYETTDMFLCTLPYYSSVGFLFDSDDLEFYLRKLAPQYTVPASFARAAEPEGPVIDFTRGDRINLITFMCMYALLSTGADGQTVNRVLETDGVQNDGLVLSEYEQGLIRSRIDSFNAAIRQAAQKRAENVHLIDIGPWLNDILTGVTPFEIGGRRLTRKWIRGGCFTFDGVHPGYTGQAVIANRMIENINTALGLQAPLHDPGPIMESDPYIDNDGDGWAPGPDYKSSGVPGMLFLFKDPDDKNPAVEPELPHDIWMRLSEALLKMI